jgi:nucleotide-binding universal stress UspA family protein
MEKYADEALAKVRAAVEKEHVACETVSSVERSPWEGIIKTAQKKKCDAIVMASHGRRGLAGILLGSETTKVLTHSKTPVLVCR